MIKKILIGLGIIFLIMQFFRPEKNHSNDRSHDITTQYEVPTDVADILKVACNDCHSNQTRYPWYAEIQPIGWWLNDHIRHGKGHLNFSAFTTKPLWVQFHKFEEIVEVLEKGEMPLASYTRFGLHSEANLSEKQKQTLYDWANRHMSAMKAQYPADSLLPKNRRRGRNPS